MTLPTKIVDVNTARWSDHLNSVHKPIQRIRSLGASAGEDALRSLGDSTSNDAWGEEFTSVTSAVYTMAMVKVRKVGNPTDGIVAKLYDNFGGGLPGTLRATSTEFKASQMSTTARWARLFFLLPYATSGVTHVAISRTGSADAANYYKIDVDSSVSSIPDFAETHLSSGSWTANSTAQLMMLLHYALPEWHTFALGVDNKLHCYKSSDAGQTWSELDSANAVAGIATATFRSICTQAGIGGQAERVAKINSTSQGAVTTFLTDSNTWLGDSSLIISSPSVNVSGQAPLFGFLRGFGVGDLSAVVYNGPTESVMGSAWRRIKISLGSSVTYDVVGSANTPSNALPGVQVHYDLRASHIDDFGNVYIWYTQSDDSLLRLRIFRINDTFCTILNPGSAASSNSSAYPVGLPTNFWRSGEAYIGLPYVDGSNTKVMTSKAGTVAETAGNWTLATAVASAAEVTASNPAALVSDNEAGGKLFLFRVRTDKSIGLSDDSGTGSWTTEQPFRSGQTVAGISAGALLNPSAIGVTYLNQAPTPDEIQHDHL